MYNYFDQYVIYLSSVKKKEEAKPRVYATDAGCAGETSNCTKKKKRARTPYGMRREQKLRDQKDFQRVFRRGRRFEKELFRVWYLPNTRNDARVAFVTPRAVDKRAAVRNSVRRRASEWIRTHTLLLGNAIDVIFFFKKEASVVTKKQFRSELEDAVRRILRP